MSYKEYRAKLDLLDAKREEYGYTELFNEKTRILRAEVALYEYYNNLFAEWAHEFVNGVQEFVNIIADESPEMKERFFKYMSENHQQVWHEFLHNENFQRWNDEKIEDFDEEE